MRAAIYRVPGRHHQAHADAMAEGLRCHGVEVSTFGHLPDSAADFCTVWGWRCGERVRQAGFTKPILVMERGFLGDRFSWTSLGWDGLNGRARWNESHDNGERFWSNFDHLAYEWERFDGYALLIGQVEGDMALKGVDFGAWCRRAVSVLQGRGFDVRFRAHPEAVKRGQPAPVASSLVMEGTLADALSSAACVVTWNSNTAVEAVLAGIPSFAVDPGSMAWPVTAHGPLDDLIMPDRSDWFRDMAWRQWSMEEISSGFAWNVVREAMKCPA